ncbi:hypothetical protein AALO_G00226980 [Alosa alosa]|uniref:Uncharacterized protein n=1 Tax=Alosa alosa TaxID=278164 RepID=A0AAV6FZM8_9TELE|nr:hypothetical protein AALO_G00226980 [Alosa alosa]
MLEITGYDDVGDSDEGPISEGLDDYDDIATDDNDAKMTKDELEETSMPMNKNRSMMTSLMKMTFN